MAAVTPSSLALHSAGDLFLRIADFAATTDDADTWDSNISGIVSVMACQADTAGTQAATGAGASFSGDVVTFHAGEDNSAITLWVYSTG
jgi:hypothetical protein